MDNRGKDNYSERKVEQNASRNYENNKGGAGQSSKVQSDVSKKVNDILKRK